LEGAPAARPQARRIAAVALVLAGSVLLSRVLGWAREMVLANYLGATPEADAYRAAFQIPDILNHFLAGGAFSLAFVPFYTRVRALRGEAAAQHVLATVFGTMAVLAVTATALVWAGAEPVVGVLFRGFAPETRELTLRLTRIVLPAQIFFVTGGVLRAALMANDRFATQALAPLVYNAGIIAGGLLFGATLGAEGFAWGALVGGIVGPFALPLLDLWRAGLRVGFRFAPWERDFLVYLALAAPLVLGLSAFMVDEWYYRYFGQFVGEGVVARLGYARILMLVPVAVVGQAVATAALPAFAQLWSEGRAGELDRAVLTTLRASLGLAVLLGAAAFALAEPTVAVLFERGRFTAADTARVASLVVVFAWAVPAWVTQQVAGRAFYAREDMWRPMLLGTALALAAIPVYQLLGARYGARGLAAAGVIALSANAGLLLAMLRLVHGGPRLAPLAATFVRALLLGGIAALAAAGAAELGEHALVRLGAGAAVFAIVAIPGTWLLGDEAMREVLRRLLRRLLRARRA
jgi:putative peptidoglycan lipid II flippase